MTNRSKQRWIAFGVVWLGVVVLTYWNMVRIEGLKTAHRQAALAQLDQRFWRRNSERIIKVRRAAAAFRQRTESLKLSLIELDHQLRGLASRYDLTNFNVIPGPQAEEEQSVPLQMIFNGRIENAVVWLAEMEQHYPFLPVHTLAITNVSSAAKTEIKIDCQYLYELIEPQPPEEG